MTRDSKMNSVSVSVSVEYCRWSRAQSVLHTIHPDWYMLHCPKEIFSGAFRVDVFEAG